MSQQTYENIVFLSGIFRTLIQLGVFAGIWKIMFPGKAKKERYTLFAVLLLVNVAAEFLAGNSWYRYILSVVFIMGYFLWKNRKLCRKAIFSMLLLYNFHASAFLLADCIYEYVITLAQKELDVYAADYLSRMYWQFGIGQIGLVALYGLFMFLFYFIYRMIGKNMPSMGWAELFFLSVINVVGIIFAYMVVDLLVVKLDNEVFLLFESKKSMLWKIPLLVSLLMAGEFSLLAIWKKYRNLLIEWQKNNVREEQLKQMKRRFEEVSAFYGDIRKMRHEMRNHMTNIKGLVASENYGDVDSYIEKMDDTIRKLDFRYSTGNPVCDVILNDKAGDAEKNHIDLDVNFSYQETTAISTFDMGIILSNLLDNAIEACGKVPEAERFIRLELNKKGAFLLVKVENSYDGKLVWDEEKKLPVSSKPNGKQGELLAEHGLGLKNVAELADKYLGGIKIEEDNTTFRVIVMLQKN